MATHIIQIAKISIALALIPSLLFIGFAYVEPSWVTAATDTDNVTVTLTVNEEISISDGANVTMAPNIGVSTNTSVGTTTWSVITNANAGYTLSVAASQSPALQSVGDQFLDYTEATPGTPDIWSVDSGNIEFGFSAVGTDVETEYDDASTNGSDETICPVVGTLGATDHGFEGFTTSNESIASRSATTTAAGITTTLCLAAEQNGVLAPSGTYTATITATAATN